MHFNNFSIQPKYAAPISGTIISIWQNIAFADVFHTVICAAVGTTVSFMVTWGLKILFKKAKKNAD
jgi:hypothetical protein